MLHTVIKGTSTVAEFKSVKEQMETLTAQGCVGIMAKWRACKELVRC